MFFLITLMMVFLSHTVFSQKVQFSWDRVDDARVAGYKIFIGESSRNYSRIITTRQFPSGIGRAKATVMGFDTSKKYFFAVKAFSSEGDESDYSDEVSFIFDIPVKPTVQMVMNQLFAEETTEEIESSTEVLPQTIMKFSWKWNPGKHYKVQRSFDLENWETIETILSDESGLVEYEYFVNSEEIQVFFRLDSG